MTQEFYALSPNRSASFVRAFLDHFLPRRIALAEDYPVPGFTESPERVLGTEHEILQFMEERTHESYGLYFRDSDPNSARQAMVFYTVDGMAIVGLADVSTDHAARLADLATYVGARYALLGWEQPPPETSREFIAL
jgi:hypothetical protein